MHSYIAIQSTYDVFEMALFINNKHVDSAHEDKRHTSKMFIPLLDQLCARNNIKFSDVSFCAVNCGPGPFSTLRSVIASVNGLHLATSIPLIGIDGLDATFLEFYDNKYQNTIVLLNAFNNEVYYLTFTPSTLGFDGDPKKEVKNTIKGYKKIDTFLKNISPDFHCAHQLTPSSISFDGDPNWNKVEIGAKGLSAQILQQVQDERGSNEIQQKHLTESIHFIGNGVTLHYELIQQICGNNAVIKEPNPPMCSVEMIGKLGLEKWMLKQTNGLPDEALRKSSEALCERGAKSGYLMPLHLKKHAVEL